MQQRGGQLLVTARGSGQLSASRLIARVPRRAVQGYATTVELPEWAKDLPPQWQAAAKPGSSYHRKMKLYFDRINFTGGGIVDIGDLTELRGFNAGSPELEAHFDRITFLFANFWSPNKDLTGHCTYDDMIRKMILANNAGRWKNMEEFVEKTPAKVTFALADANGDGKISLDEFNVFFIAHKLTPVESKPVFAELDADKDGIISREECYSAYYNWYTTPHADEDHGPGKNLWGMVPNA
ncbi:hypothetical protein HYH03_011390 [Edaphochlamys debaryana]|uniref:EF-hand domain-containing protein n=1 Tax=Edaphochlamys debaryana TaxID=47281 RepID=A0A835Y2W3_9CHLO|nr:hypothetical protein HYH03_011390 [Edaphochlamys debaryana]|eukprot:KAG2490084.1 hypothetical protein HYH03_011390 [Edaphochlamys debaryana]